MDIAKYIGLFLLKNHFCYVHGLGNLELRKLPASFDGKLLLPSLYEITITTGGSIDDSLAYFIASNEQVSISKASNELRDYSERARKEIEEGKEVMLPGIGKLIGENGRIIFITDDGFAYTPAGLPTIRNVKQLEDQVATPKSIPTNIPIPPPANDKPNNWGRIVLFFILFAVIGGGALFVYLKFKPAKKPLPPEKPWDSSAHSSPMLADSGKIKRDSLRTDSLAKLQAGSDTVAMNYKVIVNSFPDLNTAEAQLKKLKEKGTNAEIYVKDTLNYLILMQVNFKLKDSTIVYDSLKAVQRYPNVRIFK